MIDPLQWLADVLVGHDWTGKHEVENGWQYTCRSCGRVKTFPHDERTGERRLQRRGSEGDANRARESPRPHLSRQNRAPGRRASVYSHSCGAHLASRSWEWCSTLSKWRSSSTLSRAFAPTGSPLLSYSTSPSVWRPPVDESTCAYCGHPRGVHHDDRCFNDVRTLYCGWRLCRCDGWQEIA